MAAAVSSRSQTPISLSSRGGTNSECPTPISTTPSGRRVKFALKAHVREIPPNKGRDGQRRSLTNSNSQRKLFHPSDTSSNFRRASMFARNFNLAKGSSVNVTFIPALLRFRRAARVVRLFCSVCIACRKSMTYSVSQNSWVALKEALLRESDVNKDQDKDKKKSLSADDPELTFDMSKFRRQSKDKDFMPYKIKEILHKSPEFRTEDEVLNVMRTMQKMEVFARYPLQTQKKLCAVAWHEKIGPNRVVLREDHKASCIYYVISGRLVANGMENGQMSTTLLKRGDKFGEEEILSGEKRAATVMTQDTAEMFVIHCEDYENICLSKASKDISVLDICLKNPVFNHWPLDILKKNGHAWTMQNYKNGTLVVEDSSRCDWIYIIKSGKCKVVKCLKPSEPEDDPDRIKKILARHARNELLKEISMKNVENVDSEKDEVESSNSGLAPSSTFFTSAVSRPQTYDNADPKTRALIQQATRQQAINQMHASPFLVSLHGPKMDTLAYVSLEVLGHGDSFGFLAVLPRDQRGSSVSLISCGAEIIQVDKKFFQKYADETTYSLINMKFPPFPKEREILQNLRESFQWNDYKRKTLEDVLSHLYHPVKV